jgi:hypothetical protein
MSVDGNDSGSGGGRVLLYCCWRCVATLGKRSVDRLLPWRQSFLGVREICGFLRPLG